MTEGLAKYFKGDKVIWRIIFFLSIISLLAVFSATGNLAYKFKDGNTFYYFLRHGRFLFLGLLIVFITHLIPYRIYSRISQILIYISVPLLLLTLFMGRNTNDAARWLELPGLGLTLQTSDLAKLALIMFLARLLAQKQEVITDFKEAFLKILAPIAVVCVLIFPADFSTSALLFVVSLVMMFIGRVPMKHLLLLSGAIGFGIMLMLIIGFSAIKQKDTPLEQRTTMAKIAYKTRIATMSSRVQTFFADKAADDNKEVNYDKNYQSLQAKIAVANGGILPKGPGKSTQVNYLPHPYSDFIYAIIVEEYGLVGGVVILLLYLFLLYRAGTIVSKCNRAFPAFLVIGLSLMLVFQALVHMAVCVNLVPVTGQPLPLVSMGGTSLFFTGVSFGIILSVSREMEDEMSKTKEKVNNLVDDDEEYEEETEDDEFTVTNNIDEILNSKNDYE